MSWNSAALDASMHSGEGDGSMEATGEPLWRQVTLWSKSQPFRDGVRLNNARLRGGCSLLILKQVHKPMCQHEVWSYHKKRKRKGSIYAHLRAEEGGHHFKLWGPAAVMTDLGAQVCKSQPRDLRSALHVQERMVRGEHLGICMSTISLVLRDWQAKFQFTTSVYKFWATTLRRKGMALP